MSNSNFRLVACLLNISEGRRHQIIDMVAQSAVNIQNHGNNFTGINCPATVLNVFSDFDYNRSVLTIAAPIDNIEDCVYNACKTAFEYIDLSKHNGGHPRLGSVDLIPIHPIQSSVTLSECGHVARSIGKRIVECISGTSVFFFGYADIPQFRGLVTRRKGVQWYKGKAGISWSDVGWDIGMVPTQRYGCTGVGAIPYITNCNVTIDTKDLDLGRHIAQSIRASSPGGFPGVQAMAFDHEGMVEIACNVEAHQSPTDDGKFQYTNSDQIESKVRELAGKVGVKTFGTKIVGFTPEEASKRAGNALLHGHAHVWRIAGHDKRM